MDYLKIYDSICKRGKTERNLTYSEKHHIIPRCMGGNDDLSNLTTLSAKEHYIVHAILSRLHPNNDKLQYAFCMMSVSNKTVSRYIPSRHYSKTACIRSTLMTNNNPMKRPEVAEKVSNARKILFAEGKLTNPGKTENSRNKAKNRMLFDNPIKNDPSKNHTTKKTVVYYDDGSVKEFKMKKDFMDTLIGLTHMQKRYKIDKNDLKEFGVIKIEYMKKSDKKEQV